MTSGEFDPSAFTTTRMESMVERDLTAAATSEKPWSELERFLRNIGDDLAPCTSLSHHRKLLRNLNFTVDAKMFHELGCTSSKRLLAHDPLLLRIFMKEHIPQILPFHASMILAKVEKHRRDSGHSPVTSW